MKNWLTTTAGAVTITMTNDRVFSQASAVNITGQVCTNLKSMEMHNGVKSPVVFIQSTSFSEVGKTIIAIPSVTIKGVGCVFLNLNPESRIGNLKCKYALC